MASYKSRLTEDLDRWIAAGLVPASSREPILAGAPDARRLDAAQALAIVGALLFGAAAIAFVAANWGAIPRLGRFGLVLGLFLAVSAAAAWASRKRPIAADVLLAVATLVFAAGIGLTGQIFDIAGGPSAALRGAALGGAVLALAGRSTGAAAAALVFACLGDLAVDFPDRARHLPWSPAFVAAGLAAAVAWRSRILAHVAGATAIVSAGVLMARFEVLDLVVEAGLAAGLFAALAVAARSAGQRWKTAPVMLGWFVAAAMVFFVVLGFQLEPPWNLLHRAAWLGLGAAILALGRHDRHALVTALGVLALIGAVCGLLLDLGLGLMTAAGVFAVAALAALVAGWALKGRGRA